MRAIHRDQQEIASSCGVPSILLVVEKMLVLQRKPRQITGPYADHGKTLRRRLAALEPDLTAFVM